MKKKIVLLGLCVLLLGGCGEAPKLQNGEDAVVTMKDDGISADDLYKELKNSMGLEALINLIDKTILEKEYKDEIDAAKSNAEAQINNYIASYGSEEEFLNALIYYTNYTTIDSYQNYIYLSYLQNLAIKDYAKGEITDKEVKKYYKDEAVGDIAVNHILIIPEVTDGMSDADKKTAEDAALKKANEVITKLKASKDIKTDFAALAKEYSMDDSSKDNSGSLGYINKDTLGASYQELVDTAYKLKDGKYSNAAIKTSLGYHVVYRTDSKDKASLEDLEDSIKEKLADKLISSDSTTTVKGLQAIRKKYDVEIKDKELKTQYANYIQNSLSELKKNDEK